MSPAHAIVSVPPRSGRTGVADRRRGAGRAPVRPAPPSASAGAGRSGPASGSPETSGRSTATNAAHAPINATTAIHRTMSRLLEGLRAAARGPSPLPLRGGPPESWRGPRGSFVRDDPGAAHPLLRL